MAEPQYRVKVSTQVALQVAAWLLGALLAYAAMDKRVAVVEDRVNSLRSDLSEIKQDVKTLLLRRPE